MPNHYWYHTGENMAIRRVLGHMELPEFVGNIDGASSDRGREHMPNHLLQWEAMN